MRALTVTRYVFVLAMLACGGAAAGVVDDLDAVQGMALYEGPESGKDLLRENGFLVVPRFYHRIFGPYLDSPGASVEGAYVKLPPFVTADSVHRTFHVLFEESLKDAETRAHEEVKAVTMALLTALRRAPDSSESAQLAHSYFRVADALLGGVVPTEATDTAGRELALIQAADGIHESPLFGYPIDYSQFKPRGFYTKTPTLRSYFRAMAWFGCAAFRLKSERETAAALCIADAFRESEPAREAWTKLNGLYTRLLAACDDLTVAEYAAIVDGLAPELTGTARLAAIREQAWTLRDPKYNGMVLTPAQQKDWVKESKGMRFMGRRYLPDGGVFANVTDPRLPGRYFPTGLDVLAANGAARAKKHLAEASAKDPAYAAALERAASDLSDAKQATPDSHYVQLLDVMATLTAPPVEKAAAFAKTPAYADKNLTTAAAVWASARHAWILHAKQNAIYLCDTMERPLPGYIEPNPAFFDAMLRVTDNTLDILQAFDLEGAQPFKAYRHFVKELQRLLDRQLRGKAYSDADLAFFREYGMTLVRLQGHETNSPHDREFPWMALVADVFTEAATGQCLEVATGGSMPIYAIVEHEGTQYLTFGAVYSYFEFWQPTAERLTDAIWHRRWDAGTIPTMPPWTASFMAGPPDVAKVIERLRAGEYVPEAAFIQGPQFDDFLLRVARGEELAGDQRNARRMLLALAVQRMPDEVKPLLFQQLESMALPDYEGRRRRGAEIRRGEADTQEPSQEERERDQELRRAVGEVAVALGPSLGEEDLDALGRIIEEGDANRAAAVALTTLFMTDKAVERLWVRMLRDAPGSECRQTAEVSLTVRGSLDVVPDLCAAYEAAAPDVQHLILRALSGIWCEIDSYGGPPRFNSSLSIQEQENLKTRTRVLLDAVFAMEFERNEAAATDAPEPSVNPAILVSLAAAVEYSDLGDLVARAVHDGAWECDDAMAGFGRAQQAQAIPLLRRFLHDKTPAGEHGLRVCDYAADALDRVLGLEPKFRYRVPEKGLARWITLWELDAHRKELLKLTAEGGETGSWATCLIALGLLAFPGWLCGKFIYYRVRRQ